MSVIQTVINPGKLYYIRKSVNVFYSGCKCSIRRNYSDVCKQFVSFDEIVAQRRLQARRSIVVQVNSEASFKELYGYCSNYASINGIHHYKTSIGENFMLVEFNSEENVKDVLQNCSTHQEDPEVMAVQSPFLWFRASTCKKAKPTIPRDIELSTKNGLMTVNDDDLFASLLQCQDLSEQIQMLYDKTMLNDLGIRLRYMVARQVECTLESLYANIAVFPFGSSVNGFGKLGCDLDLVLTNNLTEDMCSPDKRLVYQALRSESRGAARHLELAAAALELRAAGTARIQRILHARVPILKCRHLLADLDCDLCYNNMSGVHMSTLVWSLGELDPRVRPLVFAVRRWADTVGLTNAHPGRWITNFPLTLMVLFFLQQSDREGSILPTVNTLVKLAGKEDVRIADENLNCTFLRDLNKLPPELYGQNSANLGDLLVKFFEFYAQFDFRERAISLNEGKSIRKPAALPLYIQNPLDIALNVSRNVSFEECERFKTEVRNAAWLLESVDKSEQDWGIVSLIEKKSTRSLKRLLKAGNSHRLVSVKDLFDEAKDEAKDEDEAGAGAGAKRVPFTFKNTQVAKEVYRIRRNKL